MMHYWGGPKRCHADTGVKDKRGYFHNRALCGSYARTSTPRMKKKYLTFDKNEVTCSNCENSKRWKMWVKNPALFQLAGTDLGE